MSYEGERHKPGPIARFERNRLLASGENDICRKILTCFDKKHCVLT